WHPPRDGRAQGAGTGGAGGDGRPAGAVGARCGRCGRRSAGDRDPPPGARRGARAVRRPERPRGRRELRVPRALGRPVPMNILVTGITGYVGSRLAPRLVAGRHAVRGFSRRGREAQRPAGIPVLAGDVVTGEGLEEALEGIDVAYFLIHSMEPSTDGTFSARERAAAENFARAARAADLERIVYLGG